MTLMLLPSSCTVWGTNPSTAFKEVFRSLFFSPPKNQHSLQTWLWFLFSFAESSSCIKLCCPLLEALLLFYHLITFHSSYTINDHINYNQIWHPLLIHIYWQSYAIINVQLLSEIWTCNLLPLRQELFLSTPKTESLQSYSFIKNVGYCFIAFSYQ